MRLMSVPSCENFNYGTLDSSLMGYDSERRIELSSMCGLVVTKYTHAPTNYAKSISTSIIFVTSTTIDIITKQFFLDSIS